MTVRSYGTGSLTQLRPGVWRLRVYTGKNIQGGKRQESRVIHADGKKAALKELDAFRIEVQNDRTLGPRATLGKLLTDWLANLDRLGKARSTMETYRIHVEKHIRPALGTVRLDQLTPHTIDQYLAALADKGLKERTVQLNHSVLRAALEQGVDWGWLKANAAKRARLKAAGDTKSGITAADVATLYRGAVADGDTDMAMLIALAAVTGCRRGELCGLRWDDLDAENACLRVERQWVPGEGGQHLVEHTKSGTGARTVYIGGDGVRLLEQYREVKREQVGREPDGWLISGNGGVTPMRAKSVSQYVGELAPKLGVRGTLHSLRSWKQTELNRLGVDLATAAAQGGHTVEVMARSYLHTNEEQGAAAGELIAGVVVGAIGTPHPARQVGVKDPHQPADPSGP